MNTLVVVFTLLSAPAEVAPNQPVTFAPTATIEFVAASESEADEKRVWTQCNRFVSAARQANMVGICAEVAAE